MSQVTDPVCGMTIDTANAAGQSEFQGQQYYFCSEGCKSDFDSNPGRYASVAKRPSAEDRPSA